MKITHLAQIKSLSAKKVLIEGFITELTSFINDTSTLISIEDVKKLISFKFYFKPFL